MGLTEPVTGMFPNTMAYARWGDGPKTLLFFPGGPGNEPPAGMPVRMIQKMMRPLVEHGYRVWVVTRRRNMPAGHTISDMADDCAGLIREEFGGRVDVALGESMGGMIIQYLAANHPDCADRYVVFCAGYEGSPWGKEVSRREAHAVATGDRMELGRVVGEMMFPPALRRLSRPLAPLLAAMRPSGDHEYYQQDFATEDHAALTFNARDILETIDVPVLLVCGDRDRFFPAPVVAETAALIPDSTLVWYHGQGHVRAGTSKRVGQDVLDWLQGSTSRRSRPTRDLENERRSGWRRLVAAWTPVRGQIDRMSYQRWGSGEKTLLFAPGGPGNTLPGGLFALMSSWMMRPYVAAGYTVWMVSRRRNLPTGYSIADMADDYAQLITDRFHGRVDLYLGISYGAAIGFHLAARHPETVGHIALVGFGAEADPSELENDLAYASKVSQGRIAEVGRDMATEMLPRRGCGWLAKLIGPALGRAAVGEQHAFLTRDVLIEADAERSYSAWDILPTITNPVLLVSGDRDPAAPLALIERTAGLIPDCTLRVYEDKNHEQTMMDKQLPVDILAFADRELALSI